MARDASLIEVPNFGIACQPGQSRRPLCIASRNLSKNLSRKKNFFSSFRFLFLSFRLLIFIIAIYRF